jgi:hypothetical protein
VPYGPPVAVRKNNGLAIASLACGIASVGALLVCFVASIAAIPGLITGSLALGRIRRSNGMETGRGMAIAGIITSSVGLALMIAFAVLFVIAIAAGPE